MASDRTHRVALIGAGRIAAVHLAFVRQLRNARAVAICDAVPGRAEALAREKQVAVACYTDLDVMLREAEPSIVHVVTPPVTHAALAIRAMERGANVLVEKPMAMTVEECNRMIAAARLHGRRLCVDHNRLFDPVIQRARSLLERGVVGEVVSVEAHQGVNQVELGGTAGEAHWSAESAFAPLYNLGPHPLYLVLSVLGPARDVAVMGHAARGDRPLVSEIRVLIEGERAFGIVVFSMGTQPYLNHLSVFGTRATLRVNLNTMTLVVERVHRLPKLAAKLAANLDPALQLVRGTVENVAAVALRRMKLYPGIGETIRRFYRSLDAGERPPITGEEGRDVVRLLNEIELNLERRGQTARATGSNGRVPEESTWIS